VNLGANGVKGSKFLVENVIFGISDPDLPIHYALCNVYGATMIKGSLLLSAPPLLSIFRRKKTKSRFGPKFDGFGDK